MKRFWAGVFSFAALLTAPMAAGQTLRGGSGSVQLPVATPATAPETLAGVNDPTLENALSAMGNLARWRNEERGGSVFSWRTTRRRMHVGPKPAMKRSTSG
ncbi:MAG: hypothetical protein KGS44_00135 [Alphaproteobacteria bacterium]|nr:hypothetical protein [Alphaproteobacteria bacterium]